MTILDATNKLFEWFSKNDVFRLTSMPDKKDDLNQVVLITENPESDRAVFLAALDEIEKADIIRKKAVDFNVYWILTKPLSHYEQTVAISPHTAFYIAEIINKFCDILKDDNDRCNIMKISEKDIRNLGGIINYLVN